MSSFDTRSMATIEVRGVSKRFGMVEALKEVDLRVEAGSVVALLGPSGCGKTTLLRTIAGLEVPDSGQITLGGRVLTGPGQFLGPERRHIGMVFQDWALFPHMSVARNVAYGLPKGDQSATRVSEALDMVGMASLGDRSPGTLSGGQQQRVALARALAPRPAVLLMDEPFSNLDSTLRVQVRSEVHKLLSELGMTTVFVTHDQEEAFVLGGEVAVMREGSVVQQASPAHIYAHPADPWVAGFVGDANLVTGVTDEGGRVAVTSVGLVPILADGHGRQDRVLVLVRPESLQLESGEGAMVELVEFYGHDTVYELRLDDGQQLRARTAGGPSLHQGQRVTLSYTGSATPAWPA